MNKFYNLIIGFFFVLITSACSESLEYKYSDRPMQVSCSGANEKLLNEALYSFFDDITVYYRTKSNDPSESGMSTYEAYANYVYDGALGNADYKNIVSEHSKNVMNELRKESQLWDKKPAMSNLNYNSEFVKCLITNFKDKEMVSTIQTLNTANSMTPKLMADRFRLTIRAGLEDPNYGMYIALDTYYQYLFDLEI
tara:strand:+ start:259 stop:846 length:588 start_codon:yes stop_codon:yes gene_type:complete